MRIDRRSAPTAEGRSRHWLALPLAISLLALAGCWGGDDTPTAIQVPRPDRPPATRDSQCPLDRPDTPREAVVALGKCATAWQGCHEEVLKWRVREDEIEAATMRE